MSSPPAPSAAVASRRCPSCGLEVAAHQTLCPRCRQAIPSEAGPVAASAEGSSFTFSPPPPRSPPVDAAPVVGSPVVDGSVGAPSPEPSAAPGVVASAGALGVPGAAALDERSNRPAGLLALGGATLIVIGDFLPWRRLADEELSGWQSGASAMVVLGLAVVAMAAAVALLSGVRSLVLRLGLVLGGLVAAGISLSELMRVDDTDSPEATVGLGLLLVVGGGALVVIAGALSRHRRFLPVRRPRS